VLSAKHLTHAAAPFLDDMGRNPAMDAGCVEEAFLAKSDIFSATKVIATGFNQ